MSDLRISGASANPRSESDIRLNYGNPDKIVAAANDFPAGTFVQAMFYSADGGSTWNGASLPLATGDSAQADPAVDWTSDGTAWALCIGVSPGMVLQGRCYRSTDGGQTWSFDSTFSGAQTGVDREIIWVDHSPTSPYRDRIYATWHNGIPVFVATRPGGTAGTWQTPVQVSGPETTVVGIGGDIKTNSFGDVFVFWADADGSQNILVAKSTSGGGSFGAPVTIAQTFATSRQLAIPADANRRARVYVSAGAYRTATKDLVYAVWTDLSGESGCTTGSGPGTNVASTCKTRVWFSRSVNGGGAWSVPVMLNNQSSLNDQFHAKLCVDESNGNLMVVYHDTVNDAGRLRTDVWMQQSTDDGQTWSTAVKVTSAQTDETTASANSQQYGDYNGLSGFHGTFFPTWTDRRSGGAEEIWTSRLSLVQKQCYFVVDKSTFGEDEVQAMLAAGSTTVNAAFYVMIEGFRASDLGIVASDLSGPPVHKPTLASAPAFAGMTIGQPTALLAEDPSLPTAPQRFTWVYPISFTSAAGFTQPVTIVTLSASMATVSGSAELRLVQQPNPYELDGATSWLSTDLRVFHIKAGLSKFGATVGGNTPADAINFIRQVLTNLNPGGSSGGQTFENDLDPNGTAIALNQTDTSGTAIFNFAIARVRYRGIVQDAQAVRVFFRLCPALTVSTAYDPATTYRTYWDGVQYGHKIARLGVQNTNILTIPCFATARVSPGASMDAQFDTPNVQTFVHDATGAEVDRYFGCWLDVNQPGQLVFPLNPTDEGPFSGALKSVLELVRNQHQCLIAEIAFDPDPITVGATPVTPGTSDKLAQRNLTLVPSANPGEVTSRRIPNTFELKPTLAQSPGTPDELMIDWGNMPAGSVAQIYLPTVSADEVMELSARRYSPVQFTRIDAHTLEVPVRQVTYVPIPRGGSLNHAGLLTIDLPPGVRRGQTFNAVVRQVTTRVRQHPLTVASYYEAPEGGFAGSWKQVLGTFQVSIPVESMEVLRGPEERLLSILKWILLSIPSHDRWYPVFHRYVEQVAGRVRGFGGDPELVPASPVGAGALGSAVCSRMRWLTPLLLAPLLVVVALAPAAWAAPVAAAGAVLVLALAYFWIWRCKPSLCEILVALLLGVGVAMLVLGVLVLLGYGGAGLLLMLAVLGIVTGVLVAAASLRRCCGAESPDRGASH